MKEKILIPAIIFILQGLAHSQIPAAMNETTTTRLGGNNFVVGTVYAPDGLPIQRRMRVKLVTPVAGDLVASTDDRGQFVFSGLGAGSFSVVIDREEGFEYASQSVEITESRNRVPQTYTISIRLIERSSGQKSKPGVITTGTLAAPKSASENYLKAQELIKAGDLKAAIEKLKSAIAEFPAFFEAHNELAVQYMKQGELAKADEEIVAALKIKLNAYEPRMNRGIVLYRQQRYVEAEALLRELCSEHRLQPLPRFYLGRTLVKLNKPDEAIKSFDDSIALGGDQMRESHRMLAAIYIDKDDRPRAAKELENYLRLAPDAPDSAKLKEALTQIKAAIGKP